MSATRRSVLLGAVGAFGTAVCSGGCGGKSSGGHGATATGTGSTPTPLTPTPLTPTPLASTPPTPAPTTPSAPAPTGSSTATPGGSSAAPSAGPSPSALPTTGAAWTPGPGELEPDVKRVAVEYVAAHEGAPHVIDAQYGGLLDTSASVLVVTSGGTFDVRLVQARPRWTVTEIHPSQPGPAAPSVSAAASKVLGNARVHLPPAGAADIRSGNVHDSVLTALEALSEQHELDISVVRSGHPIYVFGTNRLSDHPRGRAVDIFAIDGHAVVDPATPTALVDTLMRTAASLGAYNIGGPRQLSGPQFFSDRTHHDHVHLGFAT